MARRSKILMVKYLSKTFFIIIFFVTLCFVSCNIDLLGFFVSSDLDDRLKSRDNFFLLDGKKTDGTERNWRDLSLGDGTEYKFIVVTDTHIEDGNVFDFDRIKAAVDEHSAKFVVHLGDITQYGSAPDIDKFIDIADSLEVPCYPAIGNHDFYFSNWHVWRDKIGSTSYRIDGYSSNKSISVTLFILDSGNSFFGKEQMDWLEREIKKTGDKNNVFVFTHSPLFVEGPFDMQQVTDTKERARIVSILKNRCDIVFMGHLHKNMLNTAGNVKYLGVASFVEDKTYCLVTVNDSKVTFENKKL